MFVFRKEVISLNFFFFFFFFQKRGRPKVPKSETDGPHTPGSASKRNKVHREEDFPYADVNDPDVIKKRMQQLYTCVYDYKVSKGSSQNFASNIKPMQAN